MNGILKKDLTLKIFSVLLAMLLWLYVLNISNPYETKKINVELKIENEDSLAYKNLKLINKINRNVEVYVRGRSDIVKNILSTDFEASVDLSQINSIDDKSLKINLEHNLKDIVLDISPSTISVKLERIKTSSFPIELEVHGSPKQNYKIIRSYVKPEGVEFKDIESLVDTIDKVKVSVEIPKDLDRDYEVKKECTVYNKNGEIIADLSKNVNVDVIIEVAKEVPITLVTSGSLAEDHIEISRNIVPEKALIRAPHETLSKIEMLRTETLNIQNAENSISTTIPLSLPEGVALINTPAEIAVNIVVEKLEDKTFTIKSDEINLLNAVTDDSLTYVVNTPEVEFTFRGRRLDLDKVNLLSLKPRVDVNGLDEGTYLLPLMVDLPQNTRLLGMYEIEVVISKKTE